MNYRYVKQYTYSLHYAVAGEGPVLVLIHGFCEDHTIWSPLATKLSNQYKVILPDLAGFGESDLPVDGHLSMDIMAAHIHLILDQESVSQCVMIGHSMGGYVTLSFAEKYADMLHGFGLVHSTAMADSIDKKKRRLQSAEFIQREGVEAFTNTLIPQLFSSDIQEQSMVEAVKQEAATCTAEGLMSATLAMRDRQDRTHVLREAQVPILWVAGANDQIIPLQDIAVQSGMSRQTMLKLLSNSGHMGMLEQPETMQQALQDFMVWCLSPAS